MLQPFQKHFVSLRHLLKHLHLYEISKCQEGTCCLARITTIIREGQGEA
jgi:hypothetical protein